MNWLRRLLRRGRLERELDAELRYHVDRQVEANIRAGMSQQEARRTARLEFGGVDQIRELCRDARGTAWVDDLARDIRFGRRLLSKERGVAAVAVIALGLGIGVNSTFFTVVNAVCLRGLPIFGPERVMDVSTRDRQQQEQGVSYPDFEDMATATAAFEGLAAFRTMPMSIGDHGRAPDRVVGAYISGNAFQLLRERSIVGRTLKAQDDRRDAPGVVMLGHSLWKTRYGGDTSTIGRTVRVNGVGLIVIGVMREGFRFPSNADLWQPLTQMPGIAGQRRDVRSLAAFGRLRDGTTLAQAGTELNRLAGRLSREYPETNRGITLTAIPINSRYSGRITDPVWVAFIAAGLLVLLVACANVANLLLMRAVQRSHEMAVRASLGATRPRLVRQLLVESAILAALGGVLGLALSLAGARLLSATLTESAPYWIRFTMDGRGLLVLAGVCLGTVVVFGLVPALHVSRAGLNEVLQEAGRERAGGLRARRWTAAFLVAEFALAVVLLAAVAVGYRDFQRLQRADLVINPSHVLTSWISLPADKYRTPEQRLGFYDQWRERLSQVREVSSAAFASALPFGGAVGRALVRNDGESVHSDTLPTVSTVTVGGAYFETFEVRILRGRDFTVTDGMPGHESAIVNERFVAMYFQGRDPVGRRIRLIDRGASAQSGWMSIVGVVPAIRQRPQGDLPDPVVYVPLRSDPPASAAVILRNSSETAALASVLRGELRRLDADLPLYSVLTMGQVISRSKMNGRVSQLLVTTIALIAFGLAAVGLYAVTAHGVAQRTHEIGIRMALGARGRQITALVLRGAMRQLWLGLIVGALLTAAWERLLGDPTQRYRMTDPIVLALVALLVFVVAALTCVWAARHATQLDPVAALRRQ